MKSRPGAIVIGGSYRALGVVRSLGRHGIPVWVLTDSDRLAAYSRYTRRSFEWPAGSESEQVDFLLDLGETYALDGWLIFPTSDDNVAPVAKYHNALSRRFQVTVPPWEILRWAYDKRLTHRLAIDVGVAYPWTAYPKNRKEVEALNCSFPVILKPAFKQGENSFVRSKAWQVNNRQELLARYDEARAMVSDDVIMIQEMIPGGGDTQFSYAALCEEGRPIVSLVARRTRQYPIDVGRASSYVETIDEPEVEKASRCVLAGLGFTGLLQVQFKRDLRDGQYKLLDINPRIWGSHTLSRRFGGDFSYLLYRYFQGEPVPETRVRAGIHWVRAVSDVRSAAVEMRQGRLSLVDYINSLRPPLECAILAADDLLPFVVEVPLLAQLSRARKERSARAEGE